MSARQRFILVITALCLGGCGFHVPIPTPGEIRTQCLASCAEYSDPIAQRVCGLACGRATPTAPPRVLTATPTTAPTASTVAPSPTPTTIWVNTATCFGSPKDNPGAPGPTMRDAVVKAETAYCPSHPGRCNPEGMRVLGGFQNDFYASVVAGLVADGYEAWVDVCGGAGWCGDIQVALPGTKFMTGYAEGYHVLSAIGQNWDIQTEKYLGRCEPKWWTSAADSVVGGPTPTVTPSAAPSATPTKVAMIPPTLDHFNGCNPPAPAGGCEFAQWYKLEIPADRPQPPCTREQCPAFWRPSGMGLTCDHMFVNDGVAAGVFEPRVSRWVSIMWYVCGGRIWDDPRGPELFVTYPVHYDRPGFRKGDLFNATLYGQGTVTVCARADAYACADPADYLDHDVTYNPDKPGCAHGTVPLPGAGSCVGPFAVNH